MKSLAPRFLHSEEPLLLELVSFGARGAEGPVELGGGGAWEDVEMAAAEVVTVELEVVELVVVEEPRALEEAELSEASVTITVSVFGSVIEASRGPSSPQANGNAGFNVAKPHAEPEDVDAELVELALVEPLSILEEVDAAELFALALVVSVPVLEDAV